MQQIIKNNVRAPCKSCGNSGSKYLKDIDDYLDDVKYFTDNFINIPDAQKLITELKNGAQNTVEGGAFSVRLFKENPNGLFNAGNVSGIDLRFSEDVLNRFDVKFNNGFGEFKSYQIDNISNISIKQFTQYLGDPSLSNINNLHYLFDKRKLLAQYGTGTFQSVDDALLAVKGKFKNIFTNNAENFFKSVDQGGLGLQKIKQLFGNDVDNIDDFLDLVDNTNSTIYNFIKVK